MARVQIPHLQATSTSKQLIVNGEPFLMLAAELQNSSLTSAKYMREAWPKLKAANINTVLGCVTWEQIEPVEGTFDFGELDQVILNARSHDMHLVLLWFGSFKNGRGLDPLQLRLVLITACRTLHVCTVLGQKGQQALPTSQAAQSRW